MMDGAHIWNDYKLETIERGHVNQTKSAVTAMFAHNMHFTGDKQGQNQNLGIIVVIIWKKLRKKQENIRVKSSYSKASIKAAENLTSKRATENLISKRQN